MKEEIENLTVHEDTLSKDFIERLVWEDECHHTLIVLTYLSEEICKSIEMLSLFTENSYFTKLEFNSLWQKVRRSSLTHHSHSIHFQSQQKSY